MKLAWIAVTTILFGFCLAGLRGYSDADTSCAPYSRTAKGYAEKVQHDADRISRAHSSSNAFHSDPPALPKTGSRKFTLRASADGEYKYVEAKVVGFAGELVRLQKNDGRVAGVEINSLIEEDQAWLKQLFGHYRQANARHQQR